MATGTRIGTRIKRARERKRMSQYELAKALRVSRSAVNAWENDRAYPRSSIGALEEVLGVNLTSDERVPVEPLTPAERQYWDNLLLSGVEESQARQILEKYRQNVAAPSGRRREAS